MGSKVHEALRYHKLQALVYDILPLTTAVFSYAIEAIFFVLGFICAGVNFVGGYKSNDTPCFICFIWVVCNKTSSKLCHWRGALYLRAAVRLRGQRPPKGLGTDNYDCTSNLAPKYARKHEGKKKEKKRGGVHLDSNDFGFIWTWSVIKQTSDITWVVCNKFTTVWAQQKPNELTVFWTLWRN